MDKQKKDTVINLYNQLKRGSKKDFIADAAIVFKREESTIRTHWFGYLKQIPKGTEDQLIALLNEYIDNQKVN